MSRRLALAAIAFASLAPLAHGAAQPTPWSVTEMDPATPSGWGPIALSSDGRFLTASTVCDASACGDTMLAGRMPGGAVARTTAVHGQPAGFARLRDGAALMLTTPSARRGLTALDVSVDGRVRAARAITRRIVRDVSGASNARGSTAVAWLTNRLPQRLRVRTRGRDGVAFGPARTIATFPRDGDFGGGALAVSPRGDVAVLWAADGSLLARVRPRGKPRFGPVLRAGRSDRRAHIEAAFTSDGTLVTIWRSADGGEEQNRVAVVRVTSLPRAARAFVPARRLGEGAHAEALVFGYGLAVQAVAAGRTANVAWTTRSLQVRLATVHADGAVSAVRVLDPSGVLVGAAGSTAGRALIAWTHDPLGPEPDARAVLRVSPRMLGPIESVGPAVARVTGAVLDPAATRAIVTWGAADPLLSRRWGVAERPLR